MWVAHLQRTGTIFAPWNHQGILKDYCCLGRTPKDSEVTGLGGGLGDDNFESSPGDCKVQPRMSVTALGRVGCSDPQRQRHLSAARIPGPTPVPPIRDLHF